MELASLFGGDTSWLRKWFPVRRLVQEGGPDGKRVKVEVVVGFEPVEAGHWFLEQCGNAGIWGDDWIIRCPGIWADVHGSPVVHCGDVIQMQGGVQHQPGLKLGSVIFAAAAAAPRPGTACGPEVGQALADHMRQLWKWRHPGGELLALGLIGAGMLGAAVRWRPTGLIVGGPRSGKSEFLHLMAACAPMASCTRDATKEGIRQAISRKAMPIFIDDASDRVDQNAAQSLMELLLAAAGDSRAKASRGTGDGSGRSLEVLGVITMASVAPPETQAQHRARFTILELVEPDGGENNEAAMAAAIAGAQEAAPALWARMLSGWGRWLVALHAYRNALGRAGCAPREMDRVGALLASRWVLIDDDVPDAVVAMDGVKAVTAHIRGADEVEEGDGSRSAVQHLLSCRVARNHATDMVSISKLIEIAFEAPHAEHQDFRDANGHLLRHGIRVIRADHDLSARDRPIPRMAKGDGIWLTKSPGPLKALFCDTRFDGTRWLSVLSSLPSSRTSTASVRIGTFTGLALWIGRGCLKPPDP